MTRLFAVALLAISFVVSDSASAAPGTSEKRSEIEEGREFRRVLPAQPTAVPPGKVEVVEFFWYGCPHCFEAEKHIKTWLEQKPDGVVFRRVPATLSRGWGLMAQAYYAAEELDVLDVMHEALFAAFHTERQMLGSEERLAAYFNEKAGVDEETFRKAFRSLAVASRVQRADMLARRYQVKGVPSITVNGKFITDPEQARGHDRMMETVDTLARWELQQQGD